VRTGEAGLAALAVGIAAQPDHREGDDADQNRDGEQVLQEADPGPGPDQRDRELLAEQVPVGLDDREDQDDEAPERQEVRDAGDRPLEQLALAEHLRDLRLGVPARVRADRLDALGGGLPGHRQPVEPPQAPAGDRDGDRGQDESDDDAQGHKDLPVRRQAMRCGAAPRRCQRNAARPAADDLRRPISPRRPELDPTER
jgi:hypothetical protein